MQVRYAVGMFIAVICWAASAAGADYSYVFDRTSYTASLGSTVDVLVYLQETGATIFRDDGLIGAGVQVRFDDPPQPSSPARILTPTDILNVSDLEIEWAKDACPDEGYAGLSLGTFDTAYGLETFSGSGVYRILLGRFTFTAGMVLGEVTHIRATDFNPLYSDTIYYRNGDPLDQVVLDGDIQYATAMITTVPEPSSLWLGILGLLGVLGYKWRND